MKEVAGGAAILVDPTMPEEAAVRIAAGWPELEAMRVAGFRNVERFASKEIMEQYEDFLEKA
jgi:hypothetical protein